MPVPEVFKCCLAEIDTLRRHSLKSQTANRHFRDTLKVVVLIAAPVRLEKPAMIDIGDHLIEIQGQWHLPVAAHETENRQS